ncbi:MAG: hypothetical protein GY855_10115 [candidate division Zixibacteria bacterium]|nr:hypothetical protein [candidate division Zixibacteria bacterium]
MIKFPKILIPVFIAIFILLAIQFTDLLTLPSAEYYNSELAVTESGNTLDWKIKGVKCRGTSEYLITRLKDTGGIISITTYASANRCIIEYDSEITTPERIKNFIEAPYFESESGEWIDNLFVVVDSN